MRHLGNAQQTRTARKWVVEFQQFHVCVRSDLHMLTPKSERILWDHVFHNHRTSDNLRPFTFADPREEKTSDSVGGIITEAVASERHSCLSDEL